MSATKFCYHCAKYHPIEEMRLIATKGGSKWRCLKTIQAVKKTTAERDAFGKKVREEKAALRAPKQKAG